MVLLRKTHHLREAPLISDYGSEAVLPQTFVGEGVSRTGFKVPLECEGLELGRERKVRFQTPRSMELCADIFAQVVIVEALFQVVGVASVSGA